MPEPESETRELPCKLTHDELLARGDAMADAELEVERLKLKRGEVSDQIKSQRQLRRKLAGVVESGVERRGVRCVWIEDFPKNCFRLIRQDTGEEIDTRAMTAADRQEGMFEDDDAEGPIDDDLEAELDEEDPPARRLIDPDPEEPSAASAGRGNA